MGFVAAVVFRCGQSGRFPFRGVMSGLPLSGRLAHKLPANGVVPSVFHLPVLVFLFLLSAPYATAFFSWLSWPFSGCYGYFQVGCGLVSGLCFGLIGQTMRWSVFRCQSCRLLVGFTSNAAKQALAFCCGLGKVCILKPNNSVKGTRRPLAVLKFGFLSGFGGFVQVL